MFCQRNSYRQHELGVKNADKGPASFDAKIRHHSNQVGLLVPIRRRRWLFAAISTRLTIFSPRERRRRRRRSPGTERIRRRSRRVRYPTDRRFRIRRRARYPRRCRRRRGRSQIRRGEGSTTLEDGLEESLPCLPLPNPEFFILFFTCVHRSLAFRDFGLLSRGNERGSIKKSRRCEGE